MIHEGHTETARYADYEDGLVRSPRLLYRVPNMRSTYRVVPLDVGLPWFMRAPAP
ncbi:putative xanthine dehydrogenase subunit domain protein [Mycobacterium kansasii]|uniref:Putative xanthine dehydrogenase subunit domain protein n=1 Tax=Mycobacterium kansasii TaxID=1768 RepID=A0A1V3WJT2_MYCKA|nr:putative xanthine dehydrogenase subunit domain protein [Mycobacterium kansasii]